MRLCSANGDHSIHFIFFVLACFGSSTFFFPLKYFPVKEVALFLISSIVPWATTSPPYFPLSDQSRRPNLTLPSSLGHARQPILNYQGHVSASGSRLIVHCLVNGGPIVGSSSTYNTPVSPVPIWDAKQMRCASPPAKVAASTRECQIGKTDRDQEL